MAAAAHPPHDHNADWVHELQRLTAAADSLSTTARLAVIATIDAFAAEDGFLAQPATQARTVLAAPLLRPEAAASLPPFAEALFAALKQSLQRDSSPPHVHAV